MFKKFFKKILKIIKYYYNLYFTKEIIKINNNQKEHITDLKYGVYKINDKEKIIYENDLFVDEFIECFYCKKNKYNNIVIYTNNDFFSVYEISYILYNYVYSKNNIYIQIHIVLNIEDDFHKTGTMNISTEKFIYNKNNYKNKSYIENHIKKLIDWYNIDYNITQFNLILYYTPTSENTHKKEILYIFNKYLNMI